MGADASFSKDEGLTLSKMGEIIERLVWKKPKCLKKTKCLNENRQNTLNWEKCQAKYSKFGKLRTFSRNVEYLLESQRKKANLARNYGKIEKIQEKLPDSIFAAPCTLATHGFESNLWTEKDKNNIDNVVLLIIFTTSAIHTFSMCTCVCVCVFRCFP